jgi:beta-N-acetylhexosaminidase
MNSVGGTLEKMVGQLFVVGIRGTNIDKSRLDHLSKLGIGGVILFKQNYESLKQLIELTNSIQKSLMTQSPGNIPAWIGVDHEGGRVQRFGDPFTAFPPALSWGQLNSPKSSFEAGFTMGRELKAAGVNVNFAPVVDVPPTLQAPALGDRVFSTDPEVVATVGSATVRGLQKSGVLSVAKHFPGHGSANVDSHIDLPVCLKTVEELEACDWIPFRRAIRARVEGIMTAHMSFPKLDHDKSATLSRKILQDRLRKDLRFKGLIFSDDLDMGAIHKKYSSEEAVFLSVEAGCDHVLMCHSWDDIEPAWKALVKAFQDGVLPQKRLEESWSRIEDAKRRFLKDYREADFNEADKIIGCSEHLDVAESIRQGRVIENGPSGTESET